ncbi:MAG TPA: response regulator, partial [Polyangiaceae bacterium]|nr:response regulator [Polyangiaceae bacterium]
SALRRSCYALPVVLMSAFMDRSAVERAEAAGALDILSKPLDLNRLFNLAEEFFSPKHPVLVVEDNKALLENVTEALRDSGLVPLVGHDAESALAHRCLPRVALVDLRLPDQNGVLVARRLFARNPKMRIFYITGSEELSRELLKVPDSRTELVLKPFEMSDLLERVNAAMAVA